MLTKDDFLAARERIRDHIVLTPLQGASSLSQMLGMDVFIKNETFQKTGAFKYRGVMNTLLSTTKEELVAGVITASSGNHGKALATAASEREIAATVVLPSTAPLIKIQALQHVHARIFFSEPQRRLQLAEKIAKEEGLLFIHPFNDLRVIAGQSTIGLEILEQYPEVERIVVPMGGGGLITGDCLRGENVPSRGGDGGRRDTKCPEIHLQPSSRRIGTYAGEAFCGRCHRLEYAGHPYDRGRTQIRRSHRRCDGREYPIRPEDIG